LSAEILDTDWIVGALYLHWQFDAGKSIGVTTAPQNATLDFCKKKGVHILGNPENEATALEIQLMCLCSVRTAESILG
jgi:hypothetical protein